MLNSFYFFIIPLLISVFYIGGKYVLKKESKDQDNLEEAKNLVFDYLDNLKFNFLKYLNNFLHWLLHFFVIFLKWVSLFTHFLYEKARDFFLATASREKELVATFWHTLKEYKKEKDEQQ